MAAVGNNKNILWSPQNSLVIFTFKVDEENILGAFQTYFGSLAVWFADKHQALSGVSKMDAIWLQNLLITNNKLLDSVLFLRSVVSYNKNANGLLEDFLAREKKNKSADGR